MSLSRAERSALNGWIELAVPLAGTYFRSVEYRYMDPDEVLNGEGTAAIGGRFVPVGTKAVYLSATDQGTGTEILSRKARLGGAPQITLAKYPRIVFGVEVYLGRTLDFSPGVSPAGLADLRNRCLAPNDLGASIDTGTLFLATGIQGIVFPSVVGGAENLVVYLANCDPAALVLSNADRLVAKAKQMAAKRGL